jgi:hypothetical protein
MATLNSPTLFRGSSNWILRRSISKPFASSAVAISADVTEPKRWPASPDLRVKSSATGSSLMASASAGGILHLLDDSLVGQGSLHCQLARQQEIAAVAVGHFDQIAAVAQVNYIFLQNYFHD